ncbi:MAG: hypothetical protein HYW78_03280 [Parcubacteria group bacterium]|nr:hypothetical protein [Parcubacteria group bacterium]
MLIFIHGPDTFRSLEKLRSLKNEFMAKRDHSGLSVEEYDGEQVNFHLIDNFFRSGGLFNDKKLLIIKRLFSSKKQSYFWEQLCGIASDIRNDKNNFLIEYEGSIETKKLSQALKKWFLLCAKSTYVYEYPVLPYAELRKWILSRCAAKDIALSDELIDAIVARYGRETWRIENELEKIKAYSVSKSLNDIDETRKLFSAVSQDLVFACVDAVSMRNKKRALECLEMQRSIGEEAISILFLLGREFDLIANIQQGITPMGAYPSLIARARKNADVWNHDELREVFSRLFKIDCAIKTTKIPPYALLTEFISRI